MSKSTAVRRALTIIFGGGKAKKTAPDCAYCRHSATEVQERHNGRVFVTVCRKGQPILDAPLCPKFQDSRRNLDFNFTLVT